MLDDIYLHQVVSAIINGNHDLTDALHNRWCVQAGEDLMRLTGRLYYNPPEDEIGGL